MKTASLTQPSLVRQETKNPNLIARQPIISVLVLAFALTWAGLIPDALASQNLLPFQMPFVLTLLTGWAPGVAALVVTAIISGRAGMGQLLRRFLIARVGVQWYILALFGLAVMILLGVGLYVLLGGTADIPALHYPLVSIAIGFVLALGLGFVFNTEEILWRGFILPRLQRRHTALVATLLIAIPEALFHLPYFFNKSAHFYQNVGLVTFTGFTIALTVLFAWLFNNTRGSLLLVTLAHASQNAWAGLLSDNQAAPFALTVGLLAIAAVGVVVVFGAARLSRKPVASETGLV